LRFYEGVGVGNITALRTIQLAYSSKQVVSRTHWKTKVNGKKTTTSRKSNRKKWVECMFINKLVRMVKNVQKH
jgi:hypothetical protein